MLLNFDDAIAEAAQYSTVHVLLGNGFSIACRPDQFSYGALLDEAEFDGASVDLRPIFESLGTADFERVIELLQLAARLCDYYQSADPSLSVRFSSDAKVVREALARVLAARHPNTPFEVSDAEYQHARVFLAHFERVYTLNYDMLLYWTVMQDMDPQVVRNDGFGAPDDPDADYVVWQPYVTMTTQRVFYLHGSLHLYDSGAELAKITWSRTQVPLVDQIRAAMNSGRYPLIVTEGTSEAKVTKILHSAYLNHAIRSFSSIKGALFLYGLSLAPNDDHLLRRIVEGGLSAIYVSIFGDPSSPTNEAIIARAHQLADGRGRRRPLRVSFYEAASAHPWR